MPEAIVDLRAAGGIIELSAAPFLFKKRSDKMNNRIDAIYARQSVDKRTAFPLKARLSFANTN